MSLKRLGVRQRLRAMSRRAADLRHWVGLRRLERSRPVEYRRYLDEQLRRSLSKRGNDPGVGAGLLIGEVANHLPPAASVLCIGCRNGLELDRFRELGHDAVGIDIFSQRPDILVMDMHSLDFPDDRFDAVYASHSLEHAYDLPAVLREIARVTSDGAVAGVEVPVRHKGSDADRLEFGGLDDVRAALAPIVAEELYGEDIPARSDANEQGSAVARIVFRVRKHAA